MGKHKTKEVLLSALNHSGIKVISHDEKMINLDLSYTIEIERENLFKLLQDNHVIAPFADIAELCNFINMDMQLHEES